jgi:hypothetical protein
MPIFFSTSTYQLLKLATARSSSVFMWDRIFDAINIRARAFGPMTFVTLPSHYCRPTIAVGESFFTGSWLNVRNRREESCKELEITIIPLRVQS